MKIIGHLSKSLVAAILVAVVVIVAGVYFLFCNGESDSAKDSQFTMPEPPTMMTDPQSRAQYMALNYWNEFPFADTTYVTRSETEQIFADYIGIIAMCDTSDVKKGITKMMTKAQEALPSYMYFIEKYEKYLYDPNSPVRNEWVYNVVLESIISCPVLDDVNKIRYKHQYDLAQKNRVGEPAADFSYTTENGTTATLSKIKAKYTLLFFNNPDCQSCKQITESLLASPTVSKMIGSGSLKILAMYVDEDFKAWKNYAHNIPKQWINAYDATLTINEKNLYDLRAIPNLYLLDKTKKVILKDTTYDQIEYYLSQLAGK